MCIINKKKLSAVRKNGHYGNDLILINGYTKELTIEKAEFNSEDNFIVIKTPTMVRL